MYVCIILDYSKTALEEHKEKIDMYVEPSSAIKHGINNLEEKNIIIITGDAGIGKTSFALALMSRMQIKHQNLTALVLTDSSQWDKLDFKKEYILLIDDTFGKSKLHECAFQSWCTVFDRMDKRLQTGQVMVIFAQRNCIWHLIKGRLSDYPLFRTIVLQNAQIDLSGEFGLTGDEKARILANFCRRLNVKYCHNLYEEETLSIFSTDGLMRLSQETITTLLNMDTSCGFPFLCEQSFSDSKLSNKSIFNIFQIHSYLTYMKELVDDLLSQKKNIHYAVLVFLFLEDKSCNVDTILKAKKKIAGLGIVNSSEIIPAKIKRCLKDMMNVCIDVSDDGGFKLRHERIYSAVLLSFGENFPRKFLELISKTVLFYNVRSEGYEAGKQETFVQLYDDMTLPLAKRLIDVYGNKEEAFSEVYKHPSFQDKRLVDCFLDITANDEAFTVQLHSFIYGACEYGNDILASEVIRRCLNSDSVDTNIFKMVFQFDLIYTFRQYLKDLGFEKSFVESLHQKSFGIELFTFFINRGCRQCIMEMLNFFDTEEKELMAEREKQSMMCELTSIMQISLNKILPLHNPYCGEDWSKVLIKLSKMCKDHRARHVFVMNIILTSSINYAKLDIAYTFLEMIEPFTICVVNEFINLIFLFNNEHLFRVLCERMRRAKFQIDSWTAAELCISYTHLFKNEKMLNYFMNEFQCNFNCTCFCFGDITILHACEIAKFSDSILLRLLLRPEGRFMLTSKDAFFGRTPVQFRAAYRKIRQLDRSGTQRYSSGCLRKQDIDWGDDAIVIYSSFKYSPVVSGFSKLECQPSTKDW